MKAEGIIVPLLTPLNEDESIDFASLEGIIEHIIAGGVDGLFQNSTTGEYARLSCAERLELAKHTKEYAAGSSVTLYLGVSDTSTRGVLQNIEALSHMEPDYFVCSLPFYYPASDDREMVTFFTDVANNAGSPLILYNIPSTCGSSISINAVRELMNNKNITGIKDSSGDIDYLSELIKLCEQRPDFSVMVGSEKLLAAGAEMNCDGYVPSLANVFPKLFTDFYHAAKNGGMIAAAGYCEDIARMNLLNGYSDSWLSAMTWRKTALSRMGLCKPYMTRPNIMPTEVECAVIDGFIREFSV